MTVIVLGVCVEVSQRGKRIIQHNKIPVAPTLQLPRRKWRSQGCGRWASRWWCPFRSACTALGYEYRTGLPRNARPPPETSSSPEGPDVKTLIVWQTFGIDWLVTCFLRVGVSRSKDSTLSQKYSWGKIGFLPRHLVVLSKRDICWKRRSFNFHYFI